MDSDTGTCCSLITSSMSQTSGKPFMTASTIASLSEAFLLCRENGVDLKAARSALLGGFAQSKILDQHGLRMIEEDFQPGGTAINQLKDLVEASKVATVDGLNLPMLETNKKLWERMLEDGCTSAEAETTSQPAICGFTFATGLSNCSGR